jgi:hypothetical protein
MRTKQGVELQIRDSTRIPVGMSMPRILSTNSNKNALIKVIAKEAWCYPWAMDFVCWWKDKVTPSQRTVQSNLRCAHEEKDTKIIFCLSQLPRISTVTVVSPDTDVLVLLIRHFEKIPPRTQLRLGKTCYSISAIREKLGRRADVLTSFHALTGCDTVESFFRKGKLQAWTAFLKVHGNIGNALLALQAGAELTPDRTIHISATSSAASTAIPVLLEKRGGWPSRRRRSHLPRLHRRSPLQFSISSVLNSSR